MERGRTFRDARGALTVFELPFEVKRAFYIYDVPPDATRGGHAHRECRQQVCCIAGNFIVERWPSPGVHLPGVQLNDGDALVIEPMEWTKLSSFSRGAVCLVLCSHAYDEGDYLRSVDDWVKLWKQ